MPVYNLNARRRQHKVILHLAKGFILNFAFPVNTLITETMLFCGNTGEVFFATKVNNTE